MNLLPAKVRLRLALQPRLRAWALTVCTAAVASCAWFMCEYEHLNRDRESLVELQIQAHPLQQLARDRQRIQRKLTEISSRESILASLDADRTPLAYMAIVSRAARDTDGQLHVQEMQVQSVPVPLPADSGNRRPSNSLPEERLMQTEVVLKGAAIDDLAVAQFVRGLRDSAAFAEVELNSTREAAVLNGVIRQYEVRCVRR